MNSAFYSNGKLLLTAEYAILDGALGLALPTIFGQSLKVSEVESSTIEWKSYDEHNALWFEATYKLDELKQTPDEAYSINSSEIADVLKRILIEARQLNPEFLRKLKGYHVETKLDFALNWGLGSSSTIINNIAQWAGVDAYILLSKTFGGSGYDIACAKRNNPLLYRLKNKLPFVEEIPFDPPFKGELFFVHLNKKQDSREGIAQYNSQGLDKGLLITQVSEITRKIINCSNLSEFNELLQQHEALISETLNIPTIKASRFPDYQGAIKSLGAWGGDFILATGDIKCQNYFRTLGYNTIISYTNMVL